MTRVVRLRTRVRVPGGASYAAGEAAAFDDAASLIADGAAEAVAIEVTPAPVETVAPTGPPRDKMVRRPDVRRKDGGMGMRTW